MHISVHYWYLNIRNRIHQIEVGGVGIKPLGLKFIFFVGDLDKFITKLQNYKIEQTQGNFKEKQKYNTKPSLGIEITLFSDTVLFFVLFLNHSF